MLIQPSCDNMFPGNYSESYNEYYICVCYNLNMEPTEVVFTSLTGYNPGSVIVARISYPSNSPKNQLDTLNSHLDTP